MKAITGQETFFNILAFFKVVASSQISPHSGQFPEGPCHFRAAKIHKNPDMQILFFRESESQG
ncbi:MAG: hypothetical protein IJ314_02165 [Bacteroidales bacterium]|nr:hypothetical protein [Bacteroidales bacterium]